MANKNLPLADRSVVFQPRNPELRRLEGWYRTPKSPLYEIWEKSGTKLAFSKWLMRNGINPGDKLGKMIVSSGSFDFKVTCSYKDINRCSSMYKKQYFDSCLRPGQCNEGARLKYMRLMPCLGMMYVPDKAGHIASRAFFALIEGVIYPLRFYGDHNLKLAFDELSARSGLPISTVSVYLATWLRIIGTDRHEYVYLDTTDSYNNNF